MICYCNEPNPNFSWDHHDHGPDFDGHGCGSDSRCMCNNTFYDNVSGDRCLNCKVGNHIYYAIPCND